MPERPGLTRAVKGLYFERRPLEAVFGKTRLAVLNLQIAANIGPCPGADHQSAIAGNRQFRVSQVTARHFEQSN